MIHSQMTERSWSCSEVQIVIIELCHAGAEPEVIRLVICDRGAVWSVGRYLEVS